MSERVKAVEKTPDQLHEAQNQASEKVKESIVDLLRALNIPSSLESRGRLWDKFHAQIQSENPDITAVDKQYARSGKQNEKHNIALLKFIKGHIDRQEILDPNTLEFKSVNRTKLERLAREITSRIGLQKTKMEVEGNHATYENAKDVLLKISGTIEAFYQENYNRPYDTSAKGADGSAAGRFSAKGGTQVFDNMTGKVLDVSKDPSKASRVVDQFGREKVLSGKPALCTDIVMEYLHDAKVSYPRGNRSVYMFEKYAKENPRHYTVIPQAVKFPGYGKTLRLSVPVQVGDIITTRKKQNHMVIVTRVENGMPVEVMDSSAVNEGVGKRPFLSTSQEDTVTDAKGHTRTKAVVGPDIMVKSIIRPHYQAEELRRVAQREASAAVPKNTPPEKKPIPERPAPVIRPVPAKPQGKPAQAPAKGLSEKPV